MPLVAGAGITHNHAARFGARPAVAMREARLPGAGVEAELTRGEALVWLPR